MKNRRRQRVEEIFSEAADLPPPERSRYLGDRCAGDPELRAEVDELLKQDVRTGDLRVRPFLKRPGAHPSQIGPYRILEPIGEGGFGAVYLAEQSAPVSRRVALKLLRVGVDSKSVLARFENERQALAILDHPSIAKVFDAGSTDEGVPYFVMEHVAGLHIDAYRTRNDLSHNEVLRLFLPVCRAVQHAHYKGIIHRDLKPSNILVSEIDGQPLPKVIDFGIAKATTGALTDRTLVTRDGQFMGTPRYMSPEQARGRPEDIDSRSDVYSLGVILYELLVGKPPHDLADTSPLEAARIIAEEPIPRPGAVSPGVRGELETILLKALENEPGRRYQSAAELAEDIERYLTRRPIRARPLSTLYQIRKMAARHPAAAAGTILIPLFLAGFGVVMAIQSHRVSKERDRAVSAERLAAARLDEATAAREEVQREAEKANATIRFLEGMLSAASPKNEGPDVKVVDVLDKAVEESRTLYGDEPDIQVNLQGFLADTYYQLGMYEAAEEILTTALETCRRELGPDHRTTLATTVSLVEILRKRGRADDALRLSRSVVDDCRRVLGREDEATLLAEANLALLLLDRREFDEAESLLVSNVEAKRRVLGDEHESTLTGMNNLMTLYLDQGRLDRAATTAADLVEIHDRVLGSDHPYTLATRNNLAALLRKQGKLAEAESLYVDLLAQKRRALGPDHPSTLKTAGGLAQTLFLKEDYAGAERVGLQRYDQCLKAWGAENTQTEKARRFLVDLYEAWGKQDEARRYEAPP